MIFPRYNLIKSKLYTLIIFLLSINYTFAKSDKIRLCFNIYPPYTIGSLETTIPSGIKVDLTKAIMKEVGITPHIIYLPWARCQMEVRLGRIDGVLPAFITSDRETYSLFSDTVREQTSVFFYNKQRFPNGIDWNTNDDLGNYSISMIRASTILEELEIEYQKNRTIYFLKDLKQLLNYLSIGRTDLAALDKTVGHYHIAKNPNLRHLHSTDQVVSIRTTHIAISKASPFVHRMNDINEAISKLKRKGKIKSIVDKY